MEGKIKCHQMANKHLGTYCTVNIKILLDANYKNFKVKVKVQRV